MPRYNNTTQVLTENDLVSLTEGLFENMNFQVYKEVPLFSSSVDMILVQQNSVYAVEFKLHNWKRAITQVKKHSISVDFICICIPKSKTEETRHSIEFKCRDEGIGLFYFDLINGSPHLEFAIKPVKSKYVWEKQKARLLEYLEVHKERGVY